MTRVTVSPSTTAALIFSTSSVPHGLAQEQGLGLQGQDDGDDDQQDADAQGADAVPDAVVGEQGEADADEGEDEADERAEVLQQDHGQLGGLGAPDELAPAEGAAGLVRLLDRGAEGEALRDDREDEDADGPVPGLDRVRVVDLLVALVDGEHATDGEEHDGDEEGVDVAFPPVPEGVLGVASRWAFFPPRSSRPWLPESATEWTLSASIEEDPLKRNATNLATAMARLAASAATIALVPPDALMGADVPS